MTTHESIPCFGLIQRIYFSSTKTGEKKEAVPPSSLSSVSGLTVVVGS